MSFDMHQASNGVSSLKTATKSMVHGAFYFQPSLCPCATNETMPVQTKAKQYLLPRLALEPRLACQLFIRWLVQAFPHEGQSGKNSKGALENTGVKFSVLAYCPSQKAIHYAGIKTSVARLGMKTPSTGKPWRCNAWKDKSHLLRPHPHQTQRVTRNNTRSESPWITTVLYTLHN